WIKKSCIGAPFVYNANCTTLLANCTTGEQYSTLVLRRELLLPPPTGGSIMSWRSVPLVKKAVLVAATFLLMVPQALSGDATHAPDARPTARYHHQPASAPVVRVAPPSAVISVVVMMAPQPAREPTQVNLRGPDGQLRRFAVEGGRDAIQYQQI